MSHLVWSVPGASFSERSNGIRLLECHYQLSAGVLLSPFDDFVQTVLSVTIII